MLEDEEEVQEGRLLEDEEEVQEGATALAAQVLSDLLQVRESVRDRVELQHFRVGP